MKSFSWTKFFCSLLGTIITAVGLGTLFTTENPMFQVMSVGLLLLGVVVVQATNEEGKSNG